MPCCSGSQKCAPTVEPVPASASEDVRTGVQLSGDKQAVHQAVSTYYGQTIQKTEDLRTSACCTAKPPPQEVVDVLRKVPEEIRSKYYGCGSPFPQGLTGRRVLDLGCGTGRDCYVCSALVGEEGFVTGVDMTLEQLSVARKYADEWTQSLGYSKPNMRFVEGRIEALDAVPDASIDVVISNCVLNLSPDKPAVLSEVYRVLAPGGEMFFSDVYCSRRLPAQLRTHEVLLGECLGGALYVGDFLRLCKKVGFLDPRAVSSEPIEVHDPELRQLLGGAEFVSTTYRLFKLPDQLEDGSEDYGQTATYKGTITGQPSSYILDVDTVLPTGTAVPISGNSAAILSSSWLSQNFTVTGDTSCHLGAFGAARHVAPPAAAAAAASRCCGPSTNGCTPAAKSCTPAAKSCTPAAGGCGPAAVAAPAAGCCAPAASATPSTPSGAPSGGCCAGSTKCP